MASFRVKIFTTSAILIISQKYEENMKIILHYQAGVFKVE
jgi:hypothetical protein